MRQELNPAVGTLIKERIHQSIDVKQKMLESTEMLVAITLAATQMIKSLRLGRKVLFFGNGGSSADAQHLAAEFTGRYLKERCPLAGLALSANSSSLTAIGNDYGFEFVFARQIEALGLAGDVAVAITTSGNSSNVIRAIEAAKIKSIFTVGMTGASGGVLKELADCTLRIPSDETPRIQEAHILVGHIICEIVESAMSPPDEGVRQTASASALIAKAARY